MRFRRVSSRSPSGSRDGIGLQEYAEAVGSRIWSRLVAVTSSHSSEPVDVPFLVRTIERPWTSATARFSTTCAGGSSLR